jgi:hypothetical protein
MVELLAYAPTAFFHCQHCEFVWQQTGTAPDFHKEQLESSMPPELQQEYQQLSDWVHQAVEGYGGRVIFKIVDAASVEGLLKSVRYGVRRYPALVIAGRASPIGQDWSRAQSLIDQQLAAAA